MEFGNKVSACPAGGPAQLWVWRIAVLATALASISIRAQQPNRPSDSTTKDSAQSELTGRLLNARAARDSGSASAVIDANELVIASAARELADLRTAEGAYAQAADLYKTAQALEPRQATCWRLLRLTRALEISPRRFRSQNRFTAAIRKICRRLAFSAAHSSRRATSWRRLSSLERVAATDHSVDTQYALANCLLQTKRPAG